MANSSLQTPMLFAPADGTVSTAKLVDDSVTEAKVAPGATRSIETPVAATSGTSKTFTIPAGTKEITLFGIGIGTNGTGEIKARLGTASTLATTGYTMVQSNIRDSLSPFSADRTDAFWISDGGALASEVQTHFHLELKLIDATNHIWSCIGMARVTSNGSQYQNMISGYVDLSGECDVVGIATDGTDTLDAGTLYCTYK